MFNILQRKTPNQRKSFMLTLLLYQVKIQGQNEEMLLAACEQFLGKQEHEIQHIALVTLEGHQRAIMGSMTVEVSTSSMSSSLEDATQDAYRIVDHILVSNTKHLGHKHI
jgi:hypothetical protein